MKDGVHQQQEEGLQRNGRRRRGPQRPLGRPCGRKSLCVAHLLFHLFLELYNIIQMCARETNNNYNI